MRQEPTAIHAIGSCLSGWWRPNCDAVDKSRRHGTRRPSEGIEKIHSRACEISQTKLNTSKQQEAY
jgi:hypothetical protein